MARRQSKGSDRFLSAGYGFIVITLLFLFTVSTGGAFLFGLPQVFVLSVVFSAFMLWVLRFKVDIVPLQFAFIYLLAVIPGTVFAAFDGDIEARSFFQLICSLGTFVIAASFITAWLENNSREDLGRVLETAILFFAAFAVFEFFFYGFVLDLRAVLYGADAIPDHIFRDALLYGGPRPTGMFSEASNYARFVGVLLAAYLIVSRRVVRSFVYIGVFVVLSRSPTILFALPAIVLGLMAANPQGSLAGFWARFSQGIGGPLAAVGCVLFVALVIFSQADRLEAIQAGNERSFNERIGDPVEYLLSDWESALLGSGATAHNEMAGITKGTRQFAQVKGALIRTDAFRQAIATTITIFAAMGAIGLAIFFSGIGLLHGLNGLIWIGIFFYANFLTGGFNSATMWVPCAVMFSLCWSVLSKREGRSLSQRDVSG